jgi:hypothetical protein
MLRLFGLAKQVNYFSGIRRLGSGTLREVKVNSLVQKMQAELDEPLNKINEQAEPFRKKYFGYQKDIECIRSQQHDCGVKLDAFDKEESKILTARKEIEVIGQCMDNLISCIAEARKRESDKTGIGFNYYHKQDRFGINPDSVKVNEKIDQFIKDAKKILDVYGIKMGWGYDSGTYIINLPPTIQKSESLYGQYEQKINENTVLTGEWLDLFESELQNAYQGINEEVERKEKSAKMRPGEG